jgi:hypothetical protein
MRSTQPSADQLRRAEKQQQPPQEEEQSQQLALER